MVVKVGRSRSMGSISSEMDVDNTIKEDFIKHVDGKIFSIYWSRKISK